MVGHVWGRHTVSKEQQFAGNGADFRMGSHACFQFAVEVVRAYSFQFRRKFERPVRLFQRQDLTGVTNDVGVG